ncbi:MAG: hypothetical protein AAFP17_07475 [Pseudomonadota bacterium]
MRPTALLLSVLIALAALPAAAGPPPVPRPATLPAETRDALDALRASIEKYRDFAVAEEEGWRPFGDEEPLMGRHYHLPDGVDYAGPETRPDPTRPSNLMYSTIGGEQVLTGVAFGIRIAPGEPLPEGFAGDADIWHVHNIPAVITAATAERPILRLLAGLWLEHGFKGTEDGRDRLAMVHVWATLDNPDGVFAHHNRLVPYLKHALPPHFADGASEASARGLAIAAPEGCHKSFDGRLWVAAAERWQRRAILAACETEAEAVRAAVAACGPDGADWLNAIAEAAWLRLETTAAQILTPAQQSRIAALNEHTEAHARTVGSRGWQLPDDHPAAAHRH